MPLSPAEPGARVAVTGATGFIGRRLVCQLAARGLRVRILTRRDPASPDWRDLELELVPGSLEEPEALRRLVTGAQAVVHLAGLIKAVDRASFMAANRDGASRLAEAVQRFAPRAHFVHVSSLVAREPGLSAYAASKRAGEDAVRARLGERVSVLRPPAVYGPGDRETLLFFQLAARRWVPLFGSEQARVALIHVADLTSALAAAVGQTPSRGVQALADAQPQGYGWREIMLTAARAVGNPAPHLLPLPAGVMRVVAVAGDAARCCGYASMFNSEKLRELLHADWAVDPQELAVQPAFAPQYTLDAGFGTAVAWYRNAGWLCEP